MHGMTEGGMRALAVALTLLLLTAERLCAQAPGLGASAELVDPKVFRICADPRNLPFSNEAGEGFENKLAELFAQKPLFEPRLQPEAERHQEHAEESDRVGLERGCSPERYDKAGVDRVPHHRIRASIDHVMIGFFRD